LVNPILEGLCLSFILKANLIAITNFIIETKLISFLDVQTFNTMEF
jgi:hypothetical protein